MPATRQTAPGPDEYLIVFDGGSLGNPGKGYGSFHVTGPGGEIAHERREYGDAMTNNQAEYLTLIAALTWLRDHLGDGADRAKVVVRGDSQLVVNQVNGAWKVKNEGLRPLAQAARQALAPFRAHDVGWHRRSLSVARLGH